MTQPSKLTLASSEPCDVEHLDPKATDVRRGRLMPAHAAEALCVCDLASLVAISESAVSHQLRLLRNMRLVRARRAGRQVYYTLDDQHILSLFQQGLRHVTEERR